MQVLYTAIATAHGGRDGNVKSEDGVLDLPLAIPKSLGGAGGAKTNPEQLFAAGYAACFESALRLVARTQKVNIGDASITAHVSLGKDESGAFGLSVELHGKFGDLPREAGEKLLEAAHQVCPYSRATRGNIDVKLVVD
jgi:Ohr subfamily peroxiredoxin